MSHRYFARTIAVVAALFTPAQWTSAQEAMPEKPTAEAVYSYAIGLQLGSTFGADGVALDLESLLAGAKDGMAKAKPKYDNDTLTAALKHLDQARQSAVVTQNKKYLEENGKQEGVVTLKSGLQYKVLKSGSGATPTADSTVRTHYEGRLVDGTVFDSSYQRNEPAEFPVKGVIAGWTEALQLMKVGDKWQLFIPSELAYGESGAGGLIPPHATLIFEIELLDVVK